jgi:hypothetical protein
VTRPFGVCGHYHTQVLYGAVGRRFSVLVLLKVKSLPYKEKSAEVLELTSHDDIYIYIPVYIYTVYIYIYSYGRTRQQGGGRRTR